jgi:hypothetical protein
MPLPRTSLAGFLHAARDALTVAIQRPSPIKFVVGNESAGMSIGSYIPSFFAPNHLYLHKG